MQFQLEHSTRLEREDIQIQHCLRHVTQRVPPLSHSHYAGNARRSVISKYAKFNCAAPFVS